MFWKTLAVVVALLIAWDLFWPLMGVPQTMPWSLEKRLQSDDPPLVLDVRTPGEYSLFHIPGALNRPFPLDTGALKIPKDQEIVVACMTGHRSPIAAWRLKKAGYGRVSNLYWGMAAYRIFGGKTE
jgi:rhodanese-related sulfurtransferase